MSEYGWVAGGIFMTFFLLIVFSNMATYNAEIVCPNPQGVQSDFTGSTNITGIGIIDGVYNGASALLSPCSGLPWWIYLLIFTPLVFGIVVFVTPFIGS